MGGIGLEPQDRISGNRVRVEHSPGGIRAELGSGGRGDSNIALDDLVAVVGAQARTYAG
jgi:hypothetical protein